MDTVNVNFAEITGKIKPMHAVNNGPLKVGNDQRRHNFDSYKALEIPYARNHDAAFFAGYGGEHTVDVENIFRDFDADPFDPASYDFVLTDEYIQRTLDAGTETFYRLGAKIEHEIKKYHTVMPKDFQKYAVICEHIIRHMNYGWADGHNFGIKYWEIWNEPDIDSDESTNKRCWGGTKAQFFEFYEVMAKHLKKCFPELKIGGPAVCSSSSKWFDDFLCRMSERSVPMDFASHHIYTTDPRDIAKRSDDARKVLDKYGYTNAENILNEWNYVRDWTDRFVYSIETIIGVKGAAFVASCMCEGQNSPLDMLMYYDARPSVFNGLWDFYTMRPFKPYYSFRMFSELYRLGDEVKTECSDGLCACAAYKDGVGKLMISYYTENDECTEEKSVLTDISGIEMSEATVTVIDKERDAEIIPFDTSSHTVVMKPNSVCLITFMK